MAANCTPGATSAVYDCLVIVIDIVVFIVMNQYLKLKFLLNRHFGVPIKYAIFSF